MRPTAWERLTRIFRPFPDWLLPVSGALIAVVVGFSFIFLRRFAWVATLAVTVIVGLTWFFLYAGRRGKKVAAVSAVFGEESRLGGIIWEFLFGASLGLVFGIAFDDILWGLILGVGFGVANFFFLRER